MKPKAETLKLLMALQPKIREGMGELESHDMYYSPTYNEVNLVRYSASSKCLISSGDAILIPDAISRDPEKPERGLWGMIDWSRFGMGKRRTGNIWIISKSGHGFTSDYTFEGPPYLALLRALSWQEGVTV